MDSDSPAASRIAGRDSDHTGTSFTATARTFKPEFEATFGGDVSAGASSGLRPYRRPAGGHGHLA